MFITIKKKEFDDFIENGIVDSGYQVKENYEGREIVYLVEVPDSDNLILKIYSSVDRDHHITRGKGKDAIRIVLYDIVAKKSPLPSSKILRTEGRTTIWSRIVKSLEKMLEAASELTNCESCGATMVKRYPGGNKKASHFWGCLSFPNCDATISSNGKFKPSSVHVEPEDNSEEIILDEEMVDTEDYMNSLLEEKDSDFKAPPEFDEDNLPEITVIEVDEGDKLVPVNSLDEDEGSYPFEFFNPPQTAIFKRRRKIENVVLATPTGTGKTIASELKIVQAILDGKKACYLSPLKSVTQQIYDDWTSEDHHFSRFNISIVTGDFQLTDKRKKELAEADIILMTSEMLGARIRNYESEKNEFILQIGCLVVDEVHLLGMGKIGSMNNRGPKLEVGIIDFCRLNQDCLIVLLSATIPNCEDLADWCSILNGIDTVVIKSLWRPCKLNIHIVPVPTSSGRGQYMANQYALAESITSLVAARQNGSICFVHSKRTSGPILLNSLKEAGIDAEYHNADLNYSERVRIERNFKSRGNKTLVSTPTLAWGLNLPARDVHIKGVKRGIETVHPYDIIQMGGRAGRPGFDTEGDCFIHVPEDKAYEVEDYCRNLPPLDSLLNDEQELIFHIVAEVYNKIVKNPAEVQEWFNTSFASVLGGTISLISSERLFDELFKIKMVRKKKDSRDYFVTPLGMISTWFYLNPYDVYSWYCNFGRLNNESLFDPDDDVVISWALGNITSHIKEGFITESEANEMKGYDYLINRKGLKTYGNSLKACYAIYKALKGETSNQLKTFQRGILIDIERWICAIGLIDSMYTRWGFKNDLETMKLRIKYGCTSEQAELCKVSGVGSAILKKLWNANIRSVQDIVDRPSRVLKALSGKSGATKVAKKVIKNARILLEEEE
jgi:replicative superfamily II helicase